MQWAVKGENSHKFFGPTGLIQQHYLGRKSQHFDAWPAENRSVATNLVNCCPESLLGLSRSTFFFFFLIFFGKWGCFVFFFPYSELSGCRREGVTFVSSFLLSQIAVVRQWKTPLLLSFLEDTSIIVILESSCSCVHFVTKFSAWIIIFLSISVRNVIFVELFGF